jgi:CheR methyltransferase, SAM binding domain
VGNEPPRRSLFALKLTPVLTILAVPALLPAPRAVAVDWTDLPASIQRRLASSDVTAASFPAFRADLDRRTHERVRESDLDALIYYALQSTSFTKLSPIEPALSAKAYVQSLDAVSRARFLQGEGPPPIERIPRTVRARLASLTAAFSTPAPSGRLAYFRDTARTLTGGEDPGPSLTTLLLPEYARSMRFLYQKEFAPPQDPDPAARIAALYRTRGLSTDTTIEAGYLVHLGLATLKASQPTRRIQRVLIVGPGLDLSPRTGLLEAGPPESYQPYAVADSLVGLNFSRLDQLQVIGADVNPRVVEHLARANSANVSLTLLSGVGDSDSLSLQDDFRRYFQDLGRSIGSAATLPAQLPSSPGPELPSARVSRPRGYHGHLRKSIAVRPEASRVVDGAALNVVTERLADGPYDLVIATNIFPYFDDVSLAMALTNIAAMLAPGGVLLHNEPRPLLRELTTELGLPLAHARTAIIATVRGAPPLYDSAFVHRKS